ncbi:actin-like protein Arp6 [Obba rivulosa]|uniref:Actin-like protein ARP6 n=1 Tax=Obba rivulosa TaxID=1052685 RepID=A0A8E2DMW3_9APHY|nr:actin-like protein Arp6 [Obba rivulosa]
MKTSLKIVVDNGAYNIKAGIIGADDGTPRIIPNAVVRSKGDKTTYIGHEITKCEDHSSLHYRLPFEKGYITDWDAQKAVWDGMFSAELLNVDTSEASLLITEPYFNLSNLQDIYDQFIFEEYEFQSYYRCTPASLIPHGNLFTLPDLGSPECMLVVDSGFSFTHVVPIMNGEIVWSAVKRIDVGGKLLTNQLKELVSFRQWNMMDETYIMNDVKESCCYVSTDCKRDMEICRTDPKSNAIVQEYILPDFSLNRSGRVRQPGGSLDESYQILCMNNERFMVPEIIFRPDDIGLEQSGLAATIATSISQLPEEVQGMFWANIGLIGGNTKFAGFHERLMSELRTLAPGDCEVVLYPSNEPITEAYQSAVALAKRPDFAQRVVTRAEYLEMGSNACRRKFHDWKPIEKDLSKGRDPGKTKTGRAREDEEDDGSPSVKRGTRAKGKGRATGRRQV